MNENRIERVRAEIEAPFLVSNAVDVLYLTGLHSSNAVLLVEPDGARLFTDFRYMEKARELGIETVTVPRNIYSGLGEHVAGRIEFQAESLTYAQYATLEASGFELVPRQELMVGIRAVKEDAEKQAYQQYRAGVAREAKFGTFADLMKKGS